MPRDINRIQQDLIQAYDRAVDQRDKADISNWKKREREKFLGLLRDEGKSSLIDIGSGPGVHAMYFHEQGIMVTCVDLSPAMVARCQEKGLEAYVSDVLQVASLGKVFSAAFAINTLLHLPRVQIPLALSAIRDILTPGGLFYWGQYGGEASQGVRKEDDYEPKRFYSLMEDEQIKEMASKFFWPEKFTRIQPDPDRSFHFQSLILRVADRSLSAAN